jgi:hypothetical protein
VREDRCKFARGFYAFAPKSVVQLGCVKEAIGCH